MASPGMSASLGYVETVMATEDDSPNHSADLEMGMGVLPLLHNEGAGMLIFPVSDPSSQNTAEMKKGEVCWSVTGRSFAYCVTLFSPGQIGSSLVAGTTESHDHCVHWEPPMCPQQQQTASHDIVFRA